MKKTLFAAVAALSLAVGACGGSSGGEAAEPAQPAADPTPAPADETTPAPADETTTAPAPAENPDAQIDAAFEFTKNMVKAVADNKGDCAKTASSMDALIDENEPLIKTMMADEDMQAKYNAKYQAAQQPMIQTMLTDLGPCMQDPEVQRVMMRIQPGQ